MWTLEKLRLRGRAFGFTKVAQANTDQTKALSRTKADTLSERQGDVGQLIA